MTVLSRGWYNRANRALLGKKSGENTGYIGAETYENRRIFNHIATRKTPIIPYRLGSSPIGHPKELP